MSCFSSWVSISANLNSQSNASNPSHKIYLLIILSSISCLGSITERLYISVDSLAVLPPREPVSATPTRYGGTPCAAKISSLLSCLYSLKLASLTSVLKGLNSILTSPCPSTVGTDIISVECGDLDNSLKCSSILLSNSLLPCSSNSPGSKLPVMNTA